MSSFDFVVSPDLAAAEPDVDGPLAHKTDHSAVAVSRLIDHFRKPRWSALLSAICDEYQLCEDALFQILAAFDVDTAVGEQLDFLGKQVGERRDNRVDNDYRAAVRARMLVNRSSGKVEELYAIVLALFPDALASITEFFPASIVVDITADLGGVTLQTVATLLRQAKLGGVRLDVTLADTATSFLWAATDEADLDNGWGSDVDADLGGDYSSVG
jgi:hypothetical protein